MLSTLHFKPYLPTVKRDPFSFKDLLKNAVELLWTKFLLNLAAATIIVFLTAMWDHLLPFLAFKQSQSEDKPCLQSNLT